MILGDFIISALCYPVISFSIFELGSTFLFRPGEVVKYTYWVFTNSLTKSTPLELRVISNSYDAGMPRDYTVRRIELLRRLY
jgi:hypothetical protein